VKIDTGFVAHDHEWELGVDALDDVKAEPALELDRAGLLDHTNEQERHRTSDARSMASSPA
jgi:hypothetical protein